MEGQRKKTYTKGFTLVSTFKYRTFHLSDFRCIVAKYKIQNLNYLFTEYLN